MDITKDKRSTNNTCLFVTLAQVMDPSGRFLRAFGSQGTADGKFNYPWGITTDALGFIYVCDKENHRVQVTGVSVLFVARSERVIGRWFIEEINNTYREDFQFLCF